MQTATDKKIDFLNDLEGTNIDSSVYPELEGSRAIVIPRFATGSRRCWAVRAANIPIFCCAF